MPQQRHSKVHKSFVDPLERLVCPQSEADASTFQFLLRCYASIIGHFHELCFEHSLESTENLTLVSLGRKRDS
jgi:hypothetical protein